MTKLWASKRRAEGMRQGEGRGALWGTLMCAREVEMPNKTPWKG